MQNLKLLISKKRMVVIITVFLLILAAGWSYYQYHSAQAEISRLSGTGQDALQNQKEVEALIGQIKKHLILPDNEKPTVATVTDNSQLKKNQPFFDNAQNRDKVLIYVGAKKAIIYRPQDDLIVNVGFIALDGQEIQPTQTAQPAVSANLKVEVRNGTTFAGLGKDSAAKLQTGGFEVVKVGDSNIKNYEKTVVINFGSGSNDLINNLAQTFSASVSAQLPAGESSSTADALVIIGQDQVPQ